jgi:uncharacterized protein YkwD
MNSRQATTQLIDRSLVRSASQALEAKTSAFGTGVQLGGTWRASRRRASAPTTATLERSVVQQINQYRQQQGLAALTTNSVITQQARQHSQTMASQGRISHDGFSGRVQTIGKTIRYRSAGENVAYNSGFSNPVAQAVSGWLRSPGHLATLTISPKSLFGLNRSESLCEIPEPRFRPDPRFSSEIRSE